MKLSSFMRTFLLLVVVAGVMPAAPILWSLSPVNLQGCCIPPLNEQSAVLSGTILFDSQTNSYLDWDFSISGYTDPLTALNGTLTPATSTIVVGGPTFLHLMYASQQADLVMTFGYTTFGGVVEVPLSAAGGTVPVMISNSARFVSFFAYANDTVSSIPEPAGGLLVLIGAAVLCIGNPRRLLRKRTAA